MAGDDLNFPSVQIVERGFQPARGNDAAVNVYGAFIGKANQGPTAPTKVSSWNQFLSMYGSNYTDLHSAVSDYFANGGTNNPAYIVRIVAAGAQTADLDIFASDAPEDPGNPGNVLPGTPALFTFTAQSPGAWANQLYVTVTARDSSAKRFDLALFKVPTGTTFDPSKRNSEYLLESWNDVTLDPNDARYMYDIVNGPMGAGNGGGSIYVSVSGQSYDPQTPNTRPFPTTVGINKLSGGMDGTYDPLSFDMTTAYQAAIARLAEIPGPYVANIPNVTDTVIVKAAVSAAATRGDGFIVIDSPVGATPNDAKTYFESTLALSSLGSSAPSYGAMYYPWQYLPAVGSSSPNKTSLRPPGGAVVGYYMQSDATYGAWKAPAGVQARLAGAVAGERALSDADLSTLNNAHINAIRPITNNGIVIMGARTGKKYGLDRYVNVRRSVIYLREALRRATQYAVFQQNDENLWRSLTDTCQAVLGAFWSDGGLKGTTAAEAFFVRCDATNNTPTTQENGAVNVDCGAAFTAPAEFVIISIAQFDGGSTVSTSL